MGTRQNKPGNRTVATIDPKKGVSNSPDKWFNQMKQLGHIPPKYSSLDELQIDVLGLAIEGKTDQEIATATGVDYKNVIGSSFVKPEVSSTGTPRGLAMRSAREDIKPDEQLYLKQTFGDSFYEDFQRLRELEWGDKKPSNGEDVEALKERVYSALDNGAYSRSEYDPEFESAKVSADRARDQLRIAFGKNPGMAPESQVHRGHGLSALDGAGVSSRNLVEEWGLGNVSHGSAPRFDPQVLKMLNMSAGDLQALYDGYLTHRGLDINPQRYGGNYLAADESLRELKQGTTTGNPQSTVPVQSTKVSQDSIEWRDSRMEQLARQRAIELEDAGLSKSAALTQARTEMRDKSYQASTLFDTTQTTGGPVTSTKPELRKVGTVVTPGNENRTDQFGRPTRPSKATERPIFESTGQRVSTTQNLDLSYGTINFRPQVATSPPPQVTPKPAPKPAPKVTSKPKPPPVKASSKPPAATRLKITVPARSTLKLPPAPRTRMAASQEIRRLANSGSDVLNIIPGEWRPSNLPGI